VEMDDRLLAQRIAQGDNLAFETFFNDNKLKVLNLCYGMVHNRDKAEDLCQDVFLEVWSSISSFQGKSKLSTWLYRIAINKAINYLRKEKIKRFFVPFESVDYYIQSSERVDLSMQEKEKIVQMSKIIDTLPSKQKQALIMFIYDQMPQKEIAEIMNVSLPSVEVLIHRAKKKIKQRMDKIYGNAFE